MIHLWGGYWSVIGKIVSEYFLHPKAYIGGDGWTKIER